MTLEEIDISGLTYPELNELREMVEIRMEELREQGVPALRERSGSTISDGAMSGISA